MFLKMMQKCPNFRMNISQWSKDYYGSIRSQTLFCTKMKFDKVKNWQTIILFLPSKILRKKYIAGCVWPSLSSRQKYLLHSGKLDYFTTQSPKALSWKRTTLKPRIHHYTSPLNKNKVKEYSIHLPFEGKCKMKNT